MNEVAGLGVAAGEVGVGVVTHPRHVKRGGRIWVRILPDKPVTKKPTETRMGKGKGPPEFWVAVVKPGRILFEMEGIPREVAQEALRLAAHKLSISTQFCERRQTTYAS